MYLLVILISYICMVALVKYKMKFESKGRDSRSEEGKKDMMRIVLSIPLFILHIFIPLLAWLSTGSMLDENGATVFVIVLVFTMTVSTFTYSYFLKKSNGKEA